MSVAEVRRLALEHYRRRQHLVQVAASRSRRLWFELDRANLSGSWVSVGPRILAVVTAAQHMAASQSDPYVGAALAAQGAGDGPVAAVVAERFSGVASDGRPLDSLLYEPVIGSLTRIRDGASLGQAMHSGMSQLLMIAATQVADAGRVSDLVSASAHRKAAGYYRVLTPPSCSRCSILAGRFYRWNAAFLRHPRCDCAAAPAVDRLPELQHDPRTYFESLSAAEQERLYTKAGAEAIRAGSDIAQVVNARRGMAAAGALTTTEGMTRRGYAGRRLRAVSKRAARLTPEGIFELASDRDDALRLLRKHGYLS